MPLAHMKRVTLRNAVFAAIFVTAQVAVAGPKDRGAAEDAAAATEYKGLGASKDPRTIVAGEYKLDPHHTSITAKIAHMSLSNYTLRFDVVTGRFAFDPAHATASDLKISIDPTSVDTGDRAFDKKIARSYFETDKYPSIAFDSAKTKIVGGHMLVDGILDFHGIKKPVVLCATYHGFAQSRLGFSGHTTFKRSDFGVGEWIPLEADEVTILVEAEFVRA